MLLEHGRELAGHVAGQTADVGPVEDPAEHAVAVNEEVIGREVVMTEICRRGKSRTRCR